MLGAGTRGDVPRLLRRAWRRDVSGHWRQHRAHDRAGRAIGQRDVLCVRARAGESLFSAAQRDRELPWNVSVVPVALFDRRATLQFALSKENFGDHRIQTAGDGAFREGSWPTIDVQAERLDQVIDVTAVARPLAVKIDTQGAEPAISRAGRRPGGRGPHRARVLSLYDEAAGREHRGRDRVSREQLREGSIVRGDTGAAPVWWPMARVAGELRRLATEASVGTAYFDVVVRK